MKMQPGSTPPPYLISSFFAEASHVRLFQSLEGAEDLTTREEPFSLKLQGLPQLKDLLICSLKTFPDCFRTTKVGHLRPSSVRFRNWGTMSLGRFLTAQILVFPNPEKECILSDILESDVPDKYFLSQKQMEQLLYKSCREDKGTEFTPVKDLDAH